MGTISDNRKILSIIAGDLQRGGVELYLLNTFSHMNLEGLDITLLIPGKVLDNSLVEDFRRLSIQVIVGNINFDEGIGRRIGIAKLIRKVLSQERYDVVHANSGLRWLHAIALSEAKVKGVPIRIAHSHSYFLRESNAAKTLGGFETRITNLCATHKIACSSNAGEYLFGSKAWNKEGVFVPNGIDTQAYAFNLDARNVLREGIGEYYVIGNVANLSPIKNHHFLIDVFASLCASKPNCCLWIVGDGPLRKELEEHALDYGISDRVVFWGQRGDVPRLMQAMDCFVLTSISEGFGLVAIEAQSAGLPCVLSDGVPRDVDAKGCTVHHMSSSASAEDWAAKVFEMADVTRDAEGFKKVREAGYDIRTTVHSIEDLYRG